MAYQNAVKLGRNKGEAGLLDGLGKALVNNLSGREQ